MKLPVALALLCVLPALSFADTLVAYSMTGGADAIYDATETSPLVSVTPITPKNLSKGSLTLTTENGRVIVFQPSTASTDAATTLANQTYFSITVSPKAGAPFRLESLRFDAAAGGATTTRTFRIFSSVTGFDASRELASDTNGGGALVTQPQLKSYVVGLKDPRFRSVTGPVEFRFYVETTVPYQTLVFDNITVVGTGTAAVGAAAPGEVLVFLLCGQSNGDGRALASALPTTPVDLREPQADVPFYYQSFNRGPATYTTLRPGSAGEPAPAGQGFGPEIAFGRSVADWAAAHRPQDRVAIVKYAKGGSSLHTDWKPDGTAEKSADGPHYQVFHRTVEKGLAALREDPALEGRKVRIAAVLWVQGESDTDGSPYGENLRRFIADIRATYGEAPFHLSSLSMNQTVFSKGSPGAFSAFEGVRRAQREVATTMPLVTCADTDGAEFTVASDRVHFDAGGQVALGRALAEAAIASLAK